MAKFLTENHMTAATEAMNNDSGFQNAMTGKTLGLQFIVSDGPGGDIDYYLSIADGSAVMALGSLDDADASITSDYETAQALSSGELNVQMAFMTGKVKVGGNMATLMMNQGLVNEFVRVQSGLDLEFGG